MNTVLAYRLSLGFTILLTLAAFISLLGWFGSLARGAVLIPWIPLGLVALAGLNCVVRKRVIMRRR